MIADPISRSAVTTLGRYETVEVAQVAAHRMDELEWHERADLPGQLIALGHRGAYVIEPVAVPVGRRARK